MGIAQRVGPCIVALAAGALLMAAPAAAQSVPLFPAQVSGPNIDCLFSSQCAPTARDESTDIPLPGISGKAILQSRTFTAAADSRAAGRTTYQYRVDLTGATTLVESSCISNLSIEFGPVAKLPYAPGPTLRDVYEIVQGVPPNQIGFATAEQTGDVVTFTFARLICAADTVGPGSSSFFFGLASLHAPVRGVRVKIDAPGLDDIQVRSFGPQR
jgi:hypothetical protein